MPLSYGLHYRQEVSRVGKSIVDEMDSLIAYLSRAGILLGPDIYFALAVSTLSQSIPTGVLTRITNLAVQEDPFNLIALSTVRVPVAGLYLVQAGLWWDVNAGGNVRLLYLSKNGVLTRIDGRHSPTASGYFTNSLSFDVRCGEGDVFSLQGFQDSGGPLLCGSTTPGLVNYLSIRWVRP